MLMGLATPAILFTWVILFGSQSYQEWNDRFTYELTNRYLFSQIPTGTILGPLWREDILSGSVWATNKGPTPLSLQIGAARMFELTPVWIELAGNLLLYFVASASMYLYSRRELLMGIEGAGISAVMFGATAYWLSFWVGNPDLPMAVAWVPVLFLLSHWIERAVEAGRIVSVATPTVALAIAFYACATHSVLASLPVIPVILLAYAWWVLELRQSVLWVAGGLGLGLALYSPFLWSVVEATSLSGRFVGAGFLNAVDSPFNPAGWLVNARAILSQVAVGHNQYGIYLVSVLGVVVWLSLGTAWRHEQPRTRRILQFSAGAAAVSLIIGIFDVTIDYLKMWIPLIGAWHVKRFEHFLFFPVLTLVGWMIDRSLFQTVREPRSHRRIDAFRWSIVAVGGLGCLQVGYSAYRMHLVPSSIYPQNLILYAYLFLYAVVTTYLLVVLYRWALWPATDHGPFACGRQRTVGVVLLISSVSLAVSVHTYRAAVLEPKIGVAGTADPIMTYSQRYAVPSDIATAKEMNRTNGRVVDLTRPWFSDTLGPASETALLPLAGLRTPSGYNLGPTRWYESFVRHGINGRASALKYIVQIENTKDSNLEALGLLDVEYILAIRGTDVPGYVPVKSLEPDSKVLYVPADSALVEQAFISDGIVCFSREDDALEYIHHARLRDLRARAVLVLSDPEGSAICRGGGSPQAIAGAESPQIRLKRAPDRVHLEIESPSRGILTLTDAYYPGWKVMVDGVERPLLRTYITLRGVAIGPGRHTVEFLYAPRMFGLLCQFSSVLLVVSMLVAAVAWGMDHASRRYVGTYEIGK
ncbi:MAG: hypothetical protein EPO61_00870 [Nitrospirae bacterium]|nr:MAG: hypothetical protein EPO61_00870 [Nitrospirota bacterium]